METERLLNQNTNSNRKFLYPSTLPNSLEGHGYNSKQLTNGNQAATSSSKIRKRQDHGDSKVVEETELMRLRPRGTVTSLPSYTSESHSNPPANVVYLEREILPNDSLQSFALLYGCTLNDLKRANNLINEQDFFGLRRIKIPVKKHGLLTEPEEEGKRRPAMTTSLINTEACDSSLQSNKSQTTNHFNDVYIASSDDFTDDLENHYLIHPKSSNLTKESTIDSNDTGKYLKSVDKEIRKTIKSSDKIGCEKNEALEEVVSSLGSIGYRPLPWPNSKAKEWDGSSWGVNWYSLLLFFVICLILVFVCLGIKFYFINGNEINTTSSTANTNLQGR